MDNPQGGKPSTVVLAVNILWAALALGVIRLLLETPTLMANSKAMIFAGGFMLALMFYALLTVNISAGRNWARITYLVLVVADLVLSGPGIVGGFSQAPLSATLALAGSVLQLGGVVLLFMNPGKAWFSKSTP